MTAIRPLVAGNWKMNGLSPSLAELEALKADVKGKPVLPADLMVCPPATLLSRAAQVLAGSGIALGAQDCHPLPSGAHTGDISAEMLADAGATAVIVGHSERRTDHGEIDALVNAKARAAHRAGPYRHHLRWRDREGAPRPDNARGGRTPVEGVGAARVPSCQYGDRL